MRISNELQYGVSIASKVFYQINKYPPNTIIYLSRKQCLFGERHVETR